MSEEHARQFVHTVEQDSALQQKIDALDSTSAASEIVKLGAERNLHFSVEEFQHALSSHLKSSNGELSEEELGAVAGGVQGGTFYAPHTPNTNLSGVPNPTFWVKHGSFTPGGILDIAPKASPSPRPANGQAFFSSGA